MQWSSESIIESQLSIHLRSARGLKYVSFLSQHAFSALFGLFLLQLFFFWPGEMTPDSQVQYAMAVSGTYSDHHPFIMSYLWHFLDMLHKGPGLMLFFHLSLFYGALFYFMKATPEKKIFFLLVPFIPQILIYSFLIWKDVGCAFSFLFVGACLTYQTCYAQNSPLKTLPLLIILAYGTLVKFQAQYLAPLVLFWMAYVLSRNAFGKRFILNVVGVGLLFYGLLALIKVLSPPVKENHSWQYVKLYDMASIAHDTGEDIFPDFSKTPLFLMETLHQKISHQSVDELVFGKEAILVKSSDSAQMKILWNTWAKSVVTHPLLYLKHRIMNISYVLFGVPGFGPLVSLLDQHLIPGSLIYKISYGATKTVSFLLLAYFIPVILGFFYVVLGFLAWKKSVYAAPLFFLNLVGSALVVVLFFCSMAGTPRYLYLTICLVSVSHYFAYKCWKTLRTIARRI